MFWAKMHIFFNGKKLKYFQQFLILLFVTCVTNRKTKNEFSCHIHLNSFSNYYFNYLRLMILYCLIILLYLYFVVVEGPLDARSLFLQKTVFCARRYLRLTPHGYLSTYDSCMLHSTQNTHNAEIIIRIFIPLTFLTLTKLLKQNEFDFR